MKVIEITESKKTELAEGIEEMLRIGGRLMSCIDELDEDEGHMGMRRGGRRMGRRGSANTGGGYGYRQDDDPMYY